jgi:hypothetical protein
VTPDRESYDPAEFLTLAERPRRSCERPDPPLLPRHGRLALLASIVLAHLLFLAWVERWRGFEPPAPRAQQVVTVVFLSAAPDPPASPRKPRAPAEAQARERESTRAPRTRSRTNVSRSARDRPLHLVEVAPRAPSLFLADGSIAIPADVSDALASVTDDDRAFEFQVPGLRAARAFAQRAPALAYEPTRFDEHWLDEKDILTEALEKAVEKTTMTIRIPLPRSPGSKIVCKVSLLAMGGACGIVNNGEGYLVMLDDPATLDGEEDRECREWWERIVTATTAEQWQQALDRYETQCRKPLLSSDAQ